VLALAVALADELAAVESDLLLNDENGNLSNGSFAMPLGAVFSAALSPVCAGVVDDKTAGNGVCSVSDGGVLSSLMKESEFFPGLK
jgi:hypothetical protein